MKRILKKSISILMMLALMLLVNSKISYAAEPIAEVHFNFEQQYGFVAEGVTQLSSLGFTASEPYSVSYYVASDGDDYLYKDAAFTNKPASGAEKGETYYSRVKITPESGYSFNANVDIYLGEQKLVQGHPCYVEEPKLESNTLYVTVKVACKEDEVVLPMLNIPVLTSSRTPNSYMSLANSGNANIWWTIPGEDGIDDDIFAISKITSISFYTDDKCLEASKVEPTSYLGYNDYYVKAEFKISEIFDNRTGSGNNTPVYPDYGQQGFNKILYISNLKYDEKMPSLTMTSDDRRVTVKSDYPIVTWDFNSDEAYVVFFVGGQFTHVDNVVCSNVAEHELDITIFGENLPYEFNAVLESDIEQIADMDFTSGNCTLNDSKTELTFHLEVDKELDVYVHDIKPNEKFELWIEGDYKDGRDNPCGVTIIKDITPIIQSSSSKKRYTAKSLNDSCEKILGSSSKGSTRTIVPFEGKKVKSVTVTDSKGNIIEVTKNEDGTYSFKQPASNVTVEVVYKNREIKLTIGSTSASVDDETSNLDVAPILRNDRTMLPIRFVAENLGAKVEWDEKHPELVVITRGDIKIEITLGSDKAKVNGKEFTLDSVAFAENDRTYLPVRFVSEQLNAIVEWNEARPKEVLIYER